MFDKTLVDVDTFISLAAAAGDTYLWIIKLDPDNSREILYYPSASTPTSVRCPYLRLNRDRIHRIQVLRQVICHFPHPQPAWLANVTLKPWNLNDDLELAGAFAVMATASTNPATCAHAKVQSPSDNNVLRCDNVIEIDHTGNIMQANSILVYVEAKCPTCSCRVCSYRMYVESSRAYVGAVVTISCTVQCNNRTRCGSGLFCSPRRTITSGVVYLVP